MTGLHRRLTALEQIAESVRRRDMRDLVLSLPEARGFSPAKLDDAVTEALAYLDQIRAWKRTGLSEREIVKREAERIAAELGQTVDEVLAGAGVDPVAYR